MTYGIYMQYPCFDRSTDAFIGCGYSRVVAYEYETLALALKVRLRISAADADNNDEVNYVVLDNRGQQHVSLPGTYNPIDDEIPF